MYLSVWNEVAHSTDEEANEVEENDNHHSELPTSLLTLKTSAKYEEIAAMIVNISAKYKNALDCLIVTIKIVW